jgi:hypothetical protein
MRLSHSPHVHLCQTCYIGNLVDSRINHLFVCDLLKEMKPPSHAAYCNHFTVNAMPSCEFYVDNKTIRGVACKGGNSSC